MFAIFREVNVDCETDSEDESNTRNIVQAQVETRKRQWSLRKQSKKSPKASENGQNEGQSAVKKPVESPSNRGKKQKGAKSSPKPPPEENDFDQIDSVKKDTNKDREIEVLRRMVHKLNFELSKFQSPTELPDQTLSALNLAESDSKSPPPAWLTEDLRYLAPLLVAYDEEIAEKSDIIEEYESQMSMMKVK